MSGHSRATLQSGKVTTKNRRKSTPIDPELSSAYQIPADNTPM